MSSAEIVAYNYGRSLHRTLRNPDGSYPQHVKVRYGDLPEEERGAALRLGKERFVQWAWRGLADQFRGGDK